MKNSVNILLLLAVTTLLCSEFDAQAQVGAQTGSNGITMTIYPVVRQPDGRQYLITPSGKQVTVPGLGIAPDATQVSVYRDQTNHFWYTNLNGQAVAVTPEQLETAQMQINAQSGSGSVPPQMVPSPHSYYSATPSYAGGYNGIPYGTPINMDGSGRYSYEAPGGNRQFVTPTPQIMNQWQQQVPYGQQPNYEAQSPGQAAPQSQMQGSAQAHGESRMDRRREHRAERLENRSKDQASNAQSDQQFADSKMQSGETLGTGFRSRRSAREERRSKREDRRAERLDGN